MTVIETFLVLVWHFLLMFQLLLTNILCFYFYVFNSNSLYLSLIFKVHPLKLKTTFTMESWTLKRELRILQPLHRTEASRRTQCTQTSRCLKGETVPHRLLRNQKMSMLKWRRNDPTFTKKYVQSVPQTSMIKLYMEEMKICPSFFFALKKEKKYWSQDLNVALY